MFGEHNLSPLPLLTAITGSLFLGLAIQGASASPDPRNVSLASETSLPTHIVAQANFEELVEEFEEESQTVQFMEEAPLPTFSDLEGNGWETEAVYSLLARYNCLDGFPDGTFRGEEALTRYQFAAGMFACLVQVDEMLQARIDNLVTREDLALLFRALSTIFEETTVESDETNLDGLMPDPVEGNLE